MAKYRLGNVLYGDYTIRPQAYHLRSADFLSHGNIKGTGWGEGRYYYPGTKELTPLGKKHYAEMARERYRQMHGGTVNSYSDGGASSGKSINKSSSSGRSFGDSIRNKATSAMDRMIPTLKETGKDMAVGIIGKSVPKVFEKGGELVNFALSNADSLEKERQRKRDIQNFEPIGAAVDYYSPSEIGMLITKGYSPKDIDDMYRDGYTHEDISEWSSVNPLTDEENNPQRLQSAYNTYLASRYNPYHANPIYMESHRSQEIPIEPEVVPTPERNKSLEEILNENFERRDSIPWWARMDPTLESAYELHNYYNTDPNVREGLQTAGDLVVGGVVPMAESAWAIAKGTPKVVGKVVKRIAKDVVGAATSAADYLLGVDQRPKPSSIVANQNAVPYSELRSTVYDNQEVVPPYSHTDYQDPVPWWADMSPTSRLAYRMVNSKNK